MRTDPKHCCRCKQCKPRDQFAKNFGKWDGLQSWCRDCMRSYWSRYQRAA